MVHLTFGLFALAYGGAVLAALLMYRASSLPQYLAADRWSGVFAVIAHVFLIWFAALDAAESTWQFVHFAAQLLTIGFLFYAFARQYRRGERGAALASWQRRSGLPTGAGVPSTRRRP